MADSNSETIFRFNEERLDACLKSSLDRISRAGIGARDASNRKRLDIGHDLHRLWWGYYFEKTWKENNALSFVSLRISYTEPILNFPEPAIVYGALYFGKGEISNLSWKVAAGEIGEPKSVTISVENLLKIGFVSFVTENFAMAVRRIP